LSVSAAKDDASDHGTGCCGVRDAAQALQGAGQQFGGQ
jgi:hypothetical protein